MNRLNNLFQKIVHSPKLLVFFGFVFLLLLLLFFSYLGSSSVRNTPSITIPLLNTPTPTITPLLGPITQKEPFPTPTLTINWTKQDVAIASSMNIYQIKQSFINSQTTSFIAQKLNFSSTDQQSSIDENLQVWSKGNSSMVANFKDNLFYYFSGITPQTSNQNVSPDTYYLTGKNYIQNIFGTTIAQSLTPQNITYLDINDKSTSVNQAIFVRVSFYQTIDSHPLSTTSGTGGIVTFFFDKSLNLYSLSINNAYSEVSSLGSFKTAPLSDLISNSNTQALRIDASSNEDLSNETISAKNITFNQTTVQIGYYSKNNQLVPVYLLEGSIKANDTTQPGLYILPATSL